MKRAIAAALASLLIGSAFAQNAPSPARLPAMDDPARVADASPVGSNADAMFFRDALAGGEREVMLSRIAQAQSGSADIKNLASAMINEHAAMNRELMVAGKLAEPAPSPADLRAAADLKKMSGALLDRTFLDTMARDHEMAIALFERNSLSAHDSSTREMATNALPTLRQHLLAVQALQKSQTGM